MRLLVMENVEIRDLDTVSVESLNDSLVLVISPNGVDGYSKRLDAIQKILKRTEKTVLSCSLDNSRLRQLRYTNLFLLGQVRMDDLESQLAVREPVEALVVIEPEVTRMDDKVGARP